MKFIIRKPHHLTHGKTALHMRSAATEHDRKNPLLRNKQICFPVLNGIELQRFFLKKLQLFWLQLDAKSCNLETER